jgi:hypothetical protein
VYQVNAEVRRLAERATPQRSVRPRRRSTLAAAKETWPVADTRGLSMELIDTQAGVPPPHPSLWCPH